MWGRRLNELGLFGTNLCVTLMKIWSLNQLLTLQFILMYTWCSTSIMLKSYLLKRRLNFKLHLKFDWKCSLTVNVHKVQKCKFLTKTIIKTEQSICAIIEPHAHCQWEKESKRRLDAPTRYWPQNIWDVIDVTDTIFSYTFGQNYHLDILVLCSEKMEEFYQWKWRSLNKLSVH